MIHGERSTYVNGHCRCDDCKAANTAYFVGLRADGGRRPIPMPEHGTTQRYGRGCRCDKCRAANAKASRDYRKAQKEAA